MGAFIEFIGLGNGKGAISYNKTVTAVSLATFVYAVVTERNPSWPLLSFGVVIVGAGFGLKGYLGAIKQNSMTAQTQTTMDVAKVVEAIKANRDEGKGIDPA